MLVFSIVCFELDCLQSLSRAGLTALTSSCRGWWDHFDVANTGISFTPLGSGKALVAFSDSSRCMPGPGVWYMNSCSIQKRTGESQFFFSAKISSALCFQPTNVLEIPEHAAPCMSTTLVCACIASCWSSGHAVLLLNPEYQNYIFSPGNSFLSFVAII